MAMVKLLSLLCMVIPISPKGWDREHHGHAHPQLVPFVSLSLSW